MLSDVKNSSSISSASTSKENKSKQALGLRLWSFQFAEDERGVIIEGYTPEDLYQQRLVNRRTSIITKRINAAHLVTRTGNHYKLLGEIDESLSRSYGYPDSLINLFRKGFPSDWKEILFEYYDKVLETNPLNASNWFDYCQNRRRSRIAARGPNTGSLSSSFVENYENERNKSRMSLSLSQPNSLQVFPPESRRISRMSILPSTQPIPQIEEVDEEDKENTMQSASNVAVNAAEKVLAEVSESLEQTPKNRRSSRIQSLTPEVVAPSTPTTPKTSSEKRQTRKTPRSQQRIQLDQEDVAEITEVVAEENTKVPSELPTTQNDIIQEDSIPDENFKSPPVMKNAAKSPAKTSHLDTDKVTFKVPDMSFKMPNMRDNANVSRDNKFENAIPLTSWSIKFIPQSRDLGFPCFLVIGRKQDSLEEWQSNMVIDVIDGRYCRTERSTYKLVGEIDMLASARNSFPKEFVKKFYQGFPKNWKHELTELFEDNFGSLDQSIREYQHANDVSRYVGPVINDISSDANNETSETLSRSHQNESKQKTIQSDSSSDESLSDSSPCSSSDSEYDNEREEKKKKRNSIRKAQSDSDSEDDQPVKGRADPDNMRRNSLSSNLDSRGSADNGLSRALVAKHPKTPEIQLSRSGRTIRAPLAEFAGQRVRYDKDHNVIGVTDVTTNTVYSQHYHTMDSLAEHYGVVPAKRRSSEKFLAPPMMAVDRDGKKYLPKQNKLVTYSDSSDDSDDNIYRRRKNKSYHSPSDDSPIVKAKKKPAKTVDSENSDEERVRRKWEKREEKELREDVRRKQKEYLRAKLKLDKMLAEQAKRRKEKRERRYKENNKFDREAERLIRKKLQKKWEKEDRQMQEKGYIDSTSDEESSEDEWRNEEKAERKRKQSSKRNVSKEKTKAKPAKKKRRSSHRVEAEDVEYEPEPELPKKEKPWKREEIKCLKLALKAITIRSDGDWEKISRSLGGNRSSEACKQVAIAKLKWAPPVEPTKNNEHGLAERDVITAKSGTMAYKLQADKLSRKIMLKAGSQEEDCFKDIEPGDAEEQELFDESGVIDPDNSIMQLLMTPEVAPVKKANNRLFIADAMPEATPEVRKLKLQKTPHIENSVERDRQHRYVHHLNKTMNNTTRFGNSTFMNNTTYVQPTKRQADKALENLSKLDHMSKPKRKKKNEDERIFDEVEDDDDPEDEEDSF